MSKTIVESSSPSSIPDGAEPAGPSTSPMARIQRCLMKRRREIALAAVPSAILAVVVGMAMGQNVYQVKATLEYQGTQAPKALDGVYQPKTFNDLKENVLDDRLVEAMMQKSELNIPVGPLKKAKRIKTEPPEDIDAKKITIVLEWPEGDKGAEMVNNLLTIFNDDVSADRKQRLEALKTATGANLANCLARQKVVEERYKTFADEAKTSDIKESLDKITGEVTSNEKALETPKGQLASIKAQIEKTEKDIEVLKTKPNEAGKAALEKRLREIQDKLDAEKINLDTNRDTLRTKEGDLEISRGLLAKKVITQESYNKEKEVVDKLAGEVKKSLKLIDSLEKGLAAEKKNPTFPEMEAARSTLEALNRQKTGIEAEIAEKKQLLDGLKERQNTLHALQEKAVKTDVERKQVEEERKKVAEQSRELENLLSDNSKLFKESPAKPPKEPYFNTAKKIIPVVFVIPMFLFVGFLLVRDMRTTDWQTMSLVHQLGLPVLGRCTHEGTMEIDPDEARTLALRLRQFVPDDGGTILFGSINEGNEVDELLGHVGRYLAMRDERVLIVDTRIAQADPSSLIRHVERPVEMIAAEGVSVAPAPGMSGLVQYLVFEGHELREFIQPTGLGSVDFLPAGGPYPLTDVLASEPMKDLLKNLRKDYSVILLAGPPVTHTTDTEILAAYADGIVVVLNGAGSSEVALPEFFQSLREANAPLLGAVMCG